MTEIQEVADAIKVKHGQLWPLTREMAAYIAINEAGDQGHTVVANLVHELMRLNPGARKDEPEPTASLYERLNNTQMSLNDLGGKYGLDLSYEREAALGAMRLLNAIHKVLDGKEWDSDTPSDIANLLTAQGMALREPVDDCDLTAAELAEKYAGRDGGWGQHPDYLRETWAEDVSNEETLQGYWDWVVARLSEADD